MGDHERARRSVRSPAVRWLSGLLVGAVAVAVVTAVLVLLEQRVPPEHLLMLYLLVVMPIAIVWGVSLAVVIAVLSAAVYTYRFVQPFHSLEIFDPSSLAATVVFTRHSIGSRGVPYSPAAKIQSTDPTVH